MIIKTEQVDLTDIKAIDFDFIIASSGYESRSTFLFENASDIKGQEKFVLSFDNYTNLLVRINNDAIFKKLNFKSVPCSGNESNSIIEILNNSLKTKSKSELNILVDYSCMTRVWYAEILKYFYYTSKSGVITNIYFSYSYSQYVSPPENSALNKFVGPINGFYSISTPEKPTVLIIGLGYVSSRAFGLAEYFDVRPYLFIADSSFNEKFYPDVINQNKELIENVSEENIFNYPLDNLVFTETLLNHLCQDLLSNYRVVIAPVGPKPFSLLSLITSLRLNEIDVWRISAGENEIPMDKKPLGKTSTLKVTIK